VPEIKEKECVGCNLCSLVCPVNECITMVDVETDNDKMSWADYQSKLQAGEMDPIPAHP
jgi:dihydropyrimidine dehydrogenase (NAD+) subunit PreA